MNIIVVLCCMEEWNGKSEERMKVRTNNKEGTGTGTGTMSSQNTIIIREGFGLVVYTLHKWLGLKFLLEIGTWELSTWVASKLRKLKRQ